MHIKRVYLIATIAYTLFTGSTTAFAQGKSTALTLSELQSLALTQNRDLTAARFLIKEAEGRLLQAGLWPNPEIELARTSDRSFNNEGEYAGSAGFNQKFPISGRLARASKLGRVDVALAAAEVRNQERLILGETSAVARELLVIEEKLSANNKSQEILKRLNIASEKRLKLAEISQTDINLEKIELQKLDLRSSSLKIEREKNKIALNKLLGRTLEEEIIIKDSIHPTPTLSDTLGTTDQAIKRRPDYQIAVLQIDRAAAEARLAKAERWEDWTIGFSYDRDIQKFDSSIVNDQKDQFLGLRLTIPLPLWNQNQGKIASAEAAGSRARAALEALHLQISSEIQSAQVKVKQLSSVLRQYEEESLKLAEDNAHILQRSYSDGLVPISAVIQAQQQLVDIREAYTNSLEDYARALTELETASASNPLLERSSK